MEKRITYPGEKIGVIEEYIIKNNKFVYEKDGILRSKVIGLAISDMLTREIKVSPLRNIKVPEVGDIILGRIYNVSGVYGYTTIIKIIKKPELNYRYFNGIVYPPRKVLNIDSIYKAGDYIYAEIISNTNRTLHLSIKGQKYGVILAYCNECGSLLNKTNNKLKCRICGNIEKRKISKYYGRLDINE